jgi:hypothetical protein
MPILYVSHGFDEEEGVAWQFHCGNGDYDASVLQLVRLDEILGQDDRLWELADLSVGFCATRATIGQAWQRMKESW